MGNDIPPSDAIAISEIVDEMSRVVASKALRSSPQLCEFLRYIVEAALHGQADRLKGYTIAVEVMKRPANFDPQSDPIVRVQAKRLRDALEAYYADEGLLSPLIISIAKGGYTPAFQRRPAVGYPILPEEIDKRQPKRVWSVRDFVPVGLAMTARAASELFWPTKNVAPPIPAPSVKNIGHVTVAREKEDFRATRHRPSVWFWAKSGTLPVSFSLRVQTHNQ